MGKLYRRPGTANWWMAYYDHEGQRVRRSTGTKDKKAAEAKLAEAIRQSWDEEPHHRDAHRHPGSVSEMINRLAEAEMEVSQLRYEVLLALDRRIEALETDRAAAAYEHMLWPRGRPQQK